MVKAKSMFRWFFARKRCGMNFFVITKKILFLYVLALLILVRLILYFSLTSFIASNNGNLTLKSSMRKGLWFVGRKYAFRIIISVYLKLISVFCVANWRLKFGFNWRRKRVVRNCLIVRLS